MSMHSIRGGGVSKDSRRRRAPRGAGVQLREEILDATAALVLESGSAKAVSIRSVAQRVGVTPPSIYLHFDDKDALLDEVCARYFSELDEQMQRAAIGHRHPVDVLHAQGVTYVRFALQTPQLYRIATMGEARPGSAVDTALARSVFRHMHSGVQAAMDEGIYAPGDARQVALELWTAAHGVAALMIAKPYLRWGDAEVFTDRALRAVCCAQILSGLAGNDEWPPNTADRRPSFARLRSFLAQHESE